MTSAVNVPTALDFRSTSGRLNRECFCVSLDRDALCAALVKEADDPDFCERFIKARPHLFSDSPVFVPSVDVAAMERIVCAIEAAARLPGYRAAALLHAPEIARHDFGPRGVLMGYDFHLAADGPKLIEVNTNAGGAFLNAFLAKAQYECCAEVRESLNAPEVTGFDAAMPRMFGAEWTLQRGTAPLRRIAIVDDRPEEQYLYPEFILAQRLLARHGIETLIADPGQLRYEAVRLRIDGQDIDLVYNRLVDFALERPEHAALRAAYLDGAAVLTPNPHVHALFADKRNLALLSDGAALESWGLPSDMRGDLSRGVPRTVLVTPVNAASLWTDRKKLFFKPARGYGSKAVYRGDKLTKGVWAEIAAGGYVAQAFAAPSERTIRLGEETQSRKVDFRLYVYDGRILLKAARLYQGQVTNFRTPGGGFAPVFAI